MSSKSLDVANSDGETFWYFSDAAQNMGYYSEIPEINSAANTLSTWSTSRGVVVEGKNMQLTLTEMDGMGKDTFETLMWNHLVMKFIVGDAFMEIIRNDTLKRWLTKYPAYSKSLEQLEGDLKDYVKDIQRPMVRSYLSLDMYLLNEPRFDQIKEAIS